MRTIIIWQTVDGPVLIDEATTKRIENCKQLDISSLVVGAEPTGTMHLWPELVAGTIQHALEVELEPVYIKFAPLFPSIVDASKGLPRDFNMPKDDLFGDEG